MIKRPSRRTFLVGCGSTLAGAAGIGLYTWRWEPHWLEVVSHRLPIRRLPAALAGQTLMHISDVHVGSRVDDRYVIDAFRRAAALAPDIVVFTGDFISHHAGVFAQASEVYRYFPRGRLATLAILGNHDYGPGWSHPEIADRVVQTVSAFGIAVLRNQCAVVEGLQILGLDDWWAHRFDAPAAFAALLPALPTLVLSHNPDTADVPVWANFDGWILAGHTHGGQCKPPFLPPPLLPVLNKRYTAGEFDLSGRRRLYINRGVGHLWRVRFNVRPEITLHELQADLS
ncbi:MAG TPA: metallophosphoesterase [Vicinamibacterales bacterium]|nr:metallophosphoesterase [Vicinamibacterales bacterium]